MSVAILAQGLLAESAVIYGSLFPFVGPELSRLFDRPMGWNNGGKGPRPSNYETAQSRVSYTPNQRNRKYLVCTVPACKGWEWARNRRHNCRECGAKLQDLSGGKGKGSSTGQSERSTGASLHDLLAPQLAELEEKFPGLSALVQPSPPQPAPAAVLHSAQTACQQSLRKLQQSEALVATLEERCSSKLSEVSELVSELRVAQSGLVEAQSEYDTAARKAQLEVQKNKSASTEEAETNHITQLFASLSKEQLQKVSESLNVAVGQANPRVVLPIVTSSTETVNEASTALDIAVFNASPESLATASKEQFIAAAALAAPIRAAPISDVAKAPLSPSLDELTRVHEANTAASAAAASEAAASAAAAAEAAAAAAATATPVEPMQIDGHGLSDHQLDNTPLAAGAQERNGSRSPRRGSTHDDESSKASKTKKQDDATSVRSRASSVGSSKSGRSTKSNAANLEPADKFQKMAAQLQGQIKTASRSTVKVSP